MNSDNIVLDHLERLKDGFNKINFKSQEPGDGFSLNNFFITKEGQELGEQIEWLSQFCVSGFALSSLNFIELNEQLMKWFKTDFIDLIDKQKKSLKEKWKWWKLKRALKTLFDILEDYETTEEKGADEESIFEIIAEQNTRYLSTFILSACTYTEVFAKNLLIKAMMIKEVNEYLFKHFNLSKKGYKMNHYDLTPSLDFQKAIMAKCRKLNGVAILDLIVKGLGENKKVKEYERKIGLKSLRGMLSYIINIRNKLAHENPLFELENNQLEQEMNEYIKNQMKEWEHQKSIIIKETPGVIKFLAIFDDFFFDIIKVVPFIQLLGFMLIAYPSLVERLVDCSLTVEKGLIR